MSAAADIKRRRTLYSVLMTPGPFTIDLSREPVEVLRARVVVPYDGPHPDEWRLDVECDQVATEFRLLVLDRWLDVYVAYGYFEKTWTYEVSVEARGIDRLMTTRIEWVHVWEGDA